MAGWGYFGVRVDNEDQRERGGESEPGSQVPGSRPKRQERATAFHFIVSIFEGGESAALSGGVEMEMGIFFPLLLAGICYPVSDLRYLVSVTPVSPGTQQPPFLEASWTAGSVF